MCNNINSIFIITFLFDIVFCKVLSSRQTYIKFRIVFIKLSNDYVMLCMMCFSFHLIIIIFIVMSHMNDHHVIWVEFIRLSSISLYWYESNIHLFLSPFSVIIFISRNLMSQLKRIP